MADITPVITQAASISGVGRATGAYIVTWGPMVKDDIGLPVGGHMVDKSVQVLGTFGAGGNARIEGSNVDASVTDAQYTVLSDIQGNALNVTAAAIEKIVECTAMIRPRITAGDVTTSVYVRMLMRG